MKKIDNQRTFATEIIKEQKNKLNIYKIVSVFLLITNIILLIVFFINRG